MRPCRVKDEFRTHFATRFQDPGFSRGRLNFSFPNRLNLEQAVDLETLISRDEIRNAVWGCGENKSPGPDGFTFEFFRKFWAVVGPGLCTAVEWFFDHGSFSIGCNSSFIALIPKTLDPKIVSDYRPICLIGSLYKAWDDTVGKLKTRLSKWKLKTLSIGGRLTLLKSVIGSTPIYNMSLYKVPKTVLNSMEVISRNFFNGIQGDERKIAWVKWSKVLAPKKQGGLGFSSYYALNRELLVKWVWRFLSYDNSLWFWVISAMHGSHTQELSASHSLTWSSIIKEMNVLKDQGVDLISDCKIRVGNSMCTSLWNDFWIGDTQLRYLFPRLYALDSNKESIVADKLQVSITSSFRRAVRGGAEAQQLVHLLDLLGPVILSNMEDRWV
ncbi:hypothetical protein Tco_0419120 [Tanacetum coccineum]